MRSIICFGIAALSLGLAVPVAAQEQGTHGLDASTSVFAVRGVVLGTPRKFETHRPVPEDHQDSRRASSAASEETLQRAVSGY